MAANTRAGTTGTSSRGQSTREFVHDLILSAQDGLTALAGGANPGTDLGQFALNRFSTVGTAGDSASLPPATQGRIVGVKNGGANSMNVFPASGQQINALGADTAFALAAGKSALFICFSPGLWDVNLTA
jgi:hypothetical protein